jgi:hypothetical protein
MSAINILWFFAGIAAGSAHVWMLWQAAQPAPRLAPWHLMRLPVIGAVLAASAVFGGILPTAAGWGLAYFATIGVIAGRSPA